MLIFAISFFLSSCFVHLFTFLSLFLHSREQWLKCAYIYYSFVVFILKTVSKSCLLTTNISNIQEVDDKNDTNVNCCKWWSLTIEDCLYKSHFELEVLSKFCTFYWMRRQLCIKGPSLRGKVMTDIFGIPNIVLIWTFLLVSELLYTVMLFFPQNQPSFLHPFIMLELQNFFPQCPDLIKSEHLPTTRYTYKCNNYTLYQNITRHYAYCLRYIDKKDKGKLDLLF